MKISKTLFKNLMRCKNFVSLLDMNQNRAAHSVKILDDLDENNLHEILDTVETDDIFSELSENARDIFNHMFEEETGEDLTIATSAQLKAFEETFKKVEMLATMHAGKVFKKEVLASENTFEQKKFSYSNNGHEFYCYLDGYLEEDDVIRVFEIKATTSKKFQELHVTKRESKKKGLPKLQLPVFEKRGDIVEYIGREFVNKKVEGHLITLEDIYEIEKKLLDPYHDCGKYVFDLAIERYIIENSFKQNKDFVPNIKYYLVVLNSDYVFTGKEENGNKVYEPDENGNELFKIFDFTFITELALDEVRKKEAFICESINEKTYLDARLSRSCMYKKTTECRFCKVCFRHALKDGSSLEYLDKDSAFHSKVKLNDKGNPLNLKYYDVLNEKRFMISDCLDIIDKPKNIVQYECFVHNQVYQDVPRIKYALSFIKKPIYHLDFESYNSPLPRFRGEKPYSQSLFQYSLHKEEEFGVCDIEKNHTEFLAKDHQDRRKELVEQLIKDIDLSNGGCVLVYNQSFEKTRLKELAQIYPEYKKELDNINDHVFDLLYVLKGNKDLFQGYSVNSNAPGYTYYNNKLHGSFSIKKVLPIFTNLSYKDLDVKNGTEAILAYGELATLTDKEYNDKYLALRTYCRQDTWAMVEILRGLRKL